MFVIALTSVEVSRCRFYHAGVDGGEEEGERE
jgi:hypothetical protein